MLLALSLALTACPWGSKGFVFDVSFMKQLNTTDLRDAAGLGVGKQTATSKNPVLNGNVLVGAFNDEGSQNGDKNYLWVQDESGLLEKVSFTVETGVSVAVTDPETGKVTHYEEIITQDDLAAEVNKAVSSRGFTFVQFVPIVPEGERFNGIRQQVQRRDAGGDALMSEKGRPSRFDCGPYWTDAYHASFIIQNESGDIYPLVTGVMLDSIENGLIFDGWGRPWDWSINAAGEFQMTELVPNKEIRVGDAFCDIYGNIFVLTDLALESKGNIFFGVTMDEHGQVVGDRYFLSNQGEVVWLNMTSRWDLGFKLNGIGKVGSNGEKLSLSIEDAFTFIPKVMYGSTFDVWEIKGGVVYGTHSHANLFKFGIFNLVVEYTTSPKQQKYQQI